MALDTNLVAYWKLDESSGNAADATGNGYTLTNNNSVTYVPGLISNCADFGTANTNKYLSNSSAFLTGSFTMSLWFRNNTEVNGTYTQAALMSMNDASSVFRSILIGYNYNAGAGEIFVDYHKNNASDSSVSYTSGLLGTSVWSHVVSTYDGTTLKLYFNGSSVGTPITISGGGSGSSGSDGTYLAQIQRFSSYGSVDIDEAGLWSRALTSTEVTELYNGGAGLQYPFANAYTLTIDTGNYTLSGQDISLLRGIVMSIDAGIYTLTGIDVGLNRGYGMIIETGQYALTGMSVALRYSGWGFVSKAATSFATRAKSSSIWTYINK